ncbi:MBL fold metallo-hydrolase [Gluconobacter wancherniae]|uniref:Metal-dependent hydrolase n=1 Tax=Gluconobacter wancherniae NBRC 103581 TaxID=656744 RepID=A0A511B1R4_9PROT|nr:MBL fold metallo-hydrolase [Gluconobacter wancherniae]MBF0853571.1 MBL fold metallo-hydrolase [Gluconobacter wancherniae]MBS1063206.1 MBL fold metallo-hydrolase [Gluconobacter wancherniae]MBS1089049.1 MBL fold metallo-hydrolase [Gluconobacter wancherniae]MBS1094061.1 MBL fold metallo-hydrolase [Gluconobacter wancherniae]GBD55683.1 metal-dependent hydrolase [Gluconobacter wancherniae NBRC 103581]
MKVTVLGCGGSAGVPMIGGEEGTYTGIWGACDPKEPRNRRTRSSIVIEGEDGFRLLVDSGPDFRTQMLDCGVGRVDAVLYTHPHSDHIGGLDELRAINRVIGRPLPLLATQDVLEELRLRYAYAFAPWRGPEFYRPVFDEHLVESGQLIEFGALSGQVFDQHHGRIMSLGMRFGSFAYCTDVDTMPEEAIEILQGVDTWLVDCFQYDPHPAHAWLDRVLEWRSLIGARRTILTHMGAEMDYGTLCRMLPSDVEPAYDGMTLDLA